MAAAALYLDECIRREVAVRLRAGGFDVVTAHDASMLSASDEEQLAYATAEGRVVVTIDVRDFGQLARRWSEEGREHAGILMCERQSAGTLAGWVADAIEVYAGQSIENYVIWLPVK